MYSIVFKRACVTSCDVQRSQCQAGVLSVPHTGAIKRRHYFRLTQKKKTIPSLIIKYLRITRHSKLHNAKECTPGI
jgi:hypothetical protein